MSEDRSLHGAGSRHTLDRAREAAQASPEPVPAASELQESAAYDAERLLELERGTIDPLTVVEYGLRDGYYDTSVEHDGVTITGSYLWGGRDWRYHFAGRLVAEITVERSRRLLPGKRRIVRSGEVRNLVDIGALVDA